MREDINVKAKTRSQTADSLSSTSGFCAGCENKCPLTDLKCGKGRAIASGEFKGKHKKGHH